MNSSPKDVCRPCQCYSEAGGRLVHLADRHFGQVLRRAKRPLDIPKGWCLLPQGRKKAERNANELRRADHEVHERLRFLHLFKSVFIV